MMTSPPILQFFGGLFLFLAKVDSGGAWHHSATKPLGRGCRSGGGSALPRESGWSGTATRSCSVESRSWRFFSCRPHSLPSVTVALTLKTDREEAVGTESGGTGTGARKDDVDDEQLEVGEMYSNPVTAFLGRFLPDAPTDAATTTVAGDDEGASGSSVGEFIDDFDAPKATGLSIDDMVRRLDSGLREREWFVTGNVRPELFADDFFFKDPDVQLRGIQKYAEGVRRLFDQETSRAEIISCALDPGTTESVNASQGGGDRVQVVSVRWRLSGRVNIGPVGLNIKPYIVTSDLHVREGDGLVVFQEDTFDIPGWDLLLSSFAPWLPFLAPPAPPVSEMLTETV